MFKIESKRILHLLHKPENEYNGRKDRVQTIKLPVPSGENVFYVFLANMREYRMCYANKKYYFLK